jgi:hypothetical protein
MLLAALAAVLLRRRTRAAMPVILPADAPTPQLLLPPVEAALVAAEETAAVEVTVTATARVDIVTVVDDLLGSTS